VRYRLLGPLDVETATGERTGVHRPKHARLLAHLLLSPNVPVPVDRLVAELWPADPPPSAHGNLKTYVWALRRLLGGDTIASTPAGYRIAVGADELDTLVFQRLVREAADATRAGDSRAAGEILERALALWRGAALQNLTGWGDLDAAARLLEEQRATAEADLVDLRIAAGRHGEVIGGLRARVAAEPLRERPWGQLMRALARDGRQAEALDAYRRLRGHLVDELGVEPGPALQELHQRILAGEEARPAGAAPPDAPAPHPVPRQLPADATVFRGRAETLAALRRMLPGAGAAGRCPAVVVVVGAAGMGKTTVAVRFAHEARDRFPDGQLFLDLRGYAPTPPLTPAEALHRLLTALGVDPGAVPREVDEQAALYRSTLADRRVLVLLDNAHHPDQVRPLLPAADGAMVIVTSRDRFAGLAASHGVRRLSIGALQPVEAVAVLTDIAGRDRAAAEPAALAELAELCARTPLALRIAATKLAEDPHLAVADYNTDLRAGDRLAALAVDGDPGAAVGAVFELSYSRLGSAERRMFRLLGTAPGADIGVAGAAALAGVDRDEAARLLERLVSAHLLERAGPARFTFHDLIRLHADARAEPEERSAARHRFFSWYVHSAHAAVQLAHATPIRLPIGEPDGDPESFAAADEAMSWLDTERFTMQAAVRSAAEEGPPEAAWQLGDALRVHLDRTWHPTTWFDTARLVWEVTREHGGAAEQAAAQLGVATAHHFAGRLTEAVSHMEGALEMARAAGWERGEAIILGNLGFAQASLGRLRLANSYHARAYDINRRLGAPAAVTNLVNLAFTCTALGEIRTAVGHGEAALDLTGKGGNPLARAFSLDAIGTACHLLGEFERAFDHVGQAVEIYRQLGSRRHEAAALCVLAQAYRDVGRLTTALDLANAGRECGEDIGDRFYDATMINVLATIELRLRRRPGPAIVADQGGALEVARERGDRFTEAEVLVDLSHSHRVLGDHEEAARRAEQALDVARDGDFRLLEGRALTALADAHLLAGDRERTLALADRALPVHRETGHRLGEAQTLVVAGEAFAGCDRTEDARSAWTTARAVYADLGTPCHADALAARIAGPA